MREASRRKCSRRSRRRGHERGRTRGIQGPTRSSHHGLRFAPHKRELTHKQPTTGFKHVHGPCPASASTIAATGSRNEPIEPMPPSRFVRLAGFALLECERSARSLDDVHRLRANICCSSSVALRDAASPFLWGISYLRRSRRHEMHN